MIKRNIKRVIRIVKKGLIILVIGSVVYIYSLFGGTYRSYALADNDIKIVCEANTIMNMKATAYDLSVASCGKSRNHPEYGVTCSGSRATYGRTVAVDPKVIPLGSKLFIEFPNKYKNLTGVYTAEDTGSAIKGNRIDIYLGEDYPNDHTVHNLCLDFGIQNVKIHLQ